MADNKALYRKWRPQLFADFIGQNHVKQTILNAIRQGKVSHAYLFAGPRGTGKTSLARLVAKAVNCLDSQTGEPCGECANCVALTAGRMFDLIEIDAASHTGVDDVRELIIEKVNFAPSAGKYKVYIIDEVHMLSKHAFPALLKTLEEPPAHAIFILATTEVHKLPATIISRCQYFDFHHFSHPELVAQLGKIAQQEGMKVDDDALKIIVENAEGSMRDAISIMEQAANFADGKIDKHVLKDLLGIVDGQIVQELTQAVLDKDAVRGINLVNEMYFKGYDLNQLAKLWLNYLREMLMIKLGNEQLVQRAEDDKQLMKTQTMALSVSGIINLLQRLVEAMNSYKVASLPQLSLEMVIAKNCANEQVSAQPAGPKVSSTHQPAAPRTELCSGSGAAPRTELCSGTGADQPAVQTNSEPAILPAKPLTADTLTSVISQLCEAVSNTSPTLGSLLRTCQFDCFKGKLRIKVPSQFLKAALEKPANQVILKERLIKLGVGDIEIECVFTAANNQVETVAEVFGIM